MQLKQKKYNQDFILGNNGFVGGLTFIPGGLNEILQSEFNSLLEKIISSIKAGESYSRMAMILAPEVFAWRTRVLRYLQDYRKDLLAETKNPIHFLRESQENDEQMTILLTLFDTALQLERDIIQQAALNTQKSVPDVLANSIFTNTVIDYHNQIQHITSQYNSLQAWILERLLHSSLAVEFSSYIVYLLHKRKIVADETKRELLVMFVSEQLAQMLGCELLSLNMDALVSFGKLRDNWDDDGAVPPTESAIAAASDWLLHTNLGEIALKGGRVNTFPTRDGGIQIDIDCLDNPFEIEISPEGAMELLEYNHDLDLINRHSLQYSPF